MQESTKLKIKRILDIVYWIMLIAVLIFLVWIYYNFETFCKITQYCVCQPVATSLPLRPLTP